MKQSYVYILTNFSNRTLYTGVTADLERRVQEHKSGQGSGFTARYHVTKLVWYEVHDDIREAIAREKRIKNRSRAWKEKLIDRQNPTWSDLSKDWR